MLNHSILIHEFGVYFRDTSLNIIDIYHITFHVNSVKKRTAVLHYSTYTGTFRVVKCSAGGLLEPCSFFIARGNAINRSLTDLIQDP